MIPVHSENLRMVSQVARALTDLLPKVVFLGGAVVELLLTDPAAPRVRGTRDVDIIVQIASKSEYYQLAESLRHRNFREVITEEGPI